MFYRHLDPVVDEMLDEFRIVYITGPRQSGKTTLARVVAKRRGMRFLTLDDSTTLSAVQSDPHGFIRSLGEATVVLDEFQYAPGLVPAIKEISDRLGGQRGKFLLTGSADIFRSARIREALPGHMARLELYPLSIAEMNCAQPSLVDLLRSPTGTSPFLSREELAQLLIRGGYPEVQSKSKRARRIWFRSYVEGRLLKDFQIQYAARGDYQSKVRALVHLLAGRSGNLLKYASVGNELDLNDRVVKNYIEVLDLLFIIRRVPGYLRNRAKRQATRMPKLHFVDTGLACHLLGLTSPSHVLASQFYGNLLETLVFTECIKQAAWSEEHLELFHWRTKRGDEVDLVLEGENGMILGVEVKASASVNVHDFRGLEKLSDFAGEKFEGGIVFYTGQEVVPFQRNNKVYHAVPVALLFGMRQDETQGLA